MKNKVLITAAALCVAIALTLTLCLTLIKPKAAGYDPVTNKKEFYEVKSALADLTVYDRFETENLSEFSADNGAYNAVYTNWDERAYFEKTRKNLVSVRLTAALKKDKLTFSGLTLTGGNVEPQSYRYDFYSPYLLSPLSLMDKGPIDISILNVTVQSPQERKTALVEFFNKRYGMNLSGAGNDFLTYSGGYLIVGQLPAEAPKQAVEEKLALLEDNEDIKVANLYFRVSASDSGIYLSVPYYKLRAENRTAAGMEEWVKEKLKFLIARREAAAILLASPLYDGAKLDLTAALAYVEAHGLEYEYAAVRTRYGECLSAETAALIGETVTVKDLTILNNVAEF